jgi:hypothetical protein
MKYIITSSHKKAQFSEPDVVQQDVGQQILEPQQQPQQQPVAPAQPVSAPPVPQIDVPVIPTTLVPWKDKFTKKVKGYYLNILKVPPQSELGKALVGLGYKFKWGKFNKMVSLSNASLIEGELLSIEPTFNVIFDKSGINEIKSIFNISNVEVGDETEEELEISEEQTANRLELILEKGGSGKEKEELSKEAIQDYLKDLVASTDEAYKQDFLQRFLDFSSKIYNYSFFNTMLIWMQNPKSTRVQSATNWKEMGRQPKPTVEEINEETGQVEEVENKALEVLRPDITKKIWTSAASNFVRNLQSYPFKDANMANTNEIYKFLGYYKINKWPYNDFLFSLVKRYGATTIPNLIIKAKELVGKSLEKRWKNVYYDSAGPVTSFVGAPTYDISQTEPIPGLPPEEVFDPDAVQWQSEHNVADEAIFSLTQSAVDFAKTQKVNVNLDVDTGRAGGWSSGGEVAVSKMSQGLRQFSTVVHELAHSFLHFGDDRGVVDRAGREIEAESVVYIVLKHYGFNELQFAANYLALFTKGETSKIFDGFENVNKAVKKIIGGIEKNRDKKVAKNWFKRLKMAKNRNSFTLIDEF